MGSVSRQTVESKTALVLIESRGEEPRVDSRGVAIELGITHAPMLKLIRRYLERFESDDRGKVGFENRPSVKGQQESIALLTRRHCLFLLTLVRNSPEAVKRKDQLERTLHQLFLRWEESKLRDARAAARRASVEWQAVRAEGKTVRKQAMGTVEQLVEYARAQGSQNAGHFFQNFSRLTNSVLGIEVPATGATRDALDAATLQQVQAVEMVEAAAIIEGISAGAPYKEIYPKAKARVEALNVVKLPPPPERKALPPGPREQDLFGPEEVSP